MSEAPKTVWVTYRVIVNGIVECQCVKRGHEATEVRGPWPIGWGFVANEDCFDSREDAVRRADEVRQAEIASLKRQIERLESLEF